MLQTLGSPRDPDSTGSSAGSKSVARCEGMVAVGENAKADEVEAEAVVVDAEVEEAELAGAAVPDGDVVEAGLSCKIQTQMVSICQETIQVGTYSCKELFSH